MKACLSVTSDSESSSTKLRARISDVLGLLYTAQVMHRGHKLFDNFQCRRGSLLGVKVLHLAASKQQGEGVTEQSSSCTANPPPMQGC